MADSDASGRLLSGDVRRLTLRLSLPSLAAMLASGLATLLDALFLSRSGKEVAAAVGLCFPLVTIIQTIGFTLGMGAGSFVSRALGSGGSSGGDDAAQAVASAALYGALLLCAAFCMAGQFFPQRLLRLLGAREEVLAPAVRYARWVLASGPLVCASLVLGSLLRGQGQTTAGMIAYSAGTAAGCALCYLLVAALRLGIDGAGAAMIAREAIVLAVFIGYTLRTPGALRPSLRRFSVKPRVLAGIMRSGVPTLVRQGFMSVSGVLISRICAQLGTAAVSGMGLALRVTNLVSSAIIGFGQGFAPVCGAAYGAGNTERMREAYRFCLRVLIVSLLLLGAALFFAAPWLLGFFSPDAQAAQFGTAILRVQSAVLFAQGAVILMNMLTQSMGLPVRATLVASGRQGYVLIPLLLILPRFFGAWGIIFAQPVSDLISLAIGWALVNQITGSSSSRSGCSGARRAFR